MKPIVVVAVVLILWPSSVISADYTAKVVGISDGDTVTILTESKTQVRIRLWGIDAPEAGQDYGQKAKQVAGELCFGKTVTIQAEGSDRYGRTVAEVVLPDGRNLGREMVRSGFAWHYAKYAQADDELASLEREARAAKRGLWAQASGSPIAPWDWRSGIGLPSALGVVGNRSSRVYHSPNCNSVSRMKDANRVRFGTAGEAEGMGYRKAGDCK